MSAPAVPSSPSAAAPRWALPALILGAIAIGFSPLFVRLSELGPTATAFWRLALALPLFYGWTVVAARNRAAPPAPLGRAAKIRLLIAGLLFTGDLFSWHWSIHLTTVANSTLFANFAPIFVVFGAWAFFGERPKAVFLAGLAFTFLGAGCLIANSLSIGMEHALGDGLGIVTAVFFGSYILVVKDLRSRIDAPRLMLWSSLVTAIALLPLALATEGRIFPESAAGWLVLIALAWISQAAGQGLIAEAVGHLPAGLSSLVILVEPLAAAIIGWVLLGEALGPVELLGGALILAGIMIARRGT
ncbi:DMT family transporter [Zavarzinia compransoris]|uniref:EamA family transporter n=1 Tax=Zavarzinia compransoris TaxID=1264899 RepID=A0A317DVP5_9PROT|nr:DMT family transporter [Zavarzinia compransoris]PWR18758.1 EamA family transporter [Zavarzinia compransoris]TDP48741.1 EamA-like transporter family protein [Zavarzinia compransoris]